MVLRTVHAEFGVCAPSGFRRLGRRLPGVRPLQFPGALYGAVLLLTALSAACAPVW